MTAETGHNSAFQQDFYSLMLDALQANNDAIIDAMYAAFLMAMRDSEMTMQIDGREFGRVLRESGVQMA